MSQSYGSLVWSQYRRRPLAVAALWAVAFLVAVAVGAPLLASDQPLLFYGTRIGNYGDLYRELTLAAIPELKTALGTPRAAAALSTVLGKCATLDAQIAAPPAAREQLAAAVATGDAARLDALLAEVVAAYDPARAAFPRQLAFPVFASLTFTDLFPLLGFVFALLAFLLWRRGRLGLGRGLRLALLAALALALIRLLFPPAFATLDYKTGLADGSIIARVAVFPPFPYGINESNLAERLAPPSLKHPLGTDPTGRDLLTRVIWGGRVSLSVGFIAVGIAFAIGIVLGTLAGYYRGVVDMVLMRVIEVMICFPTFFLILAVIAFVPPSLYNIMVVIGLTSWTGIARLARGEYLRLARAEYVTAARALGVGDGRIIFRHILPNAMAPVLVEVSFDIASAILIESSLSFLGFGVTIPAPSWGGILSEARQSLRYPWLTFVPGALIFLSVTVYNLIGEGLRDATDPKLRQ